MDETKNDNDDPNSHGNEPAASTGGVCSGVINLEREVQQQIPCGDDNKKAKALWLVDGLHPTLRDETAKDGAPALLWLGGNPIKKRQVRFEDDT